MLAARGPELTTQRSAGRAPTVRWLLWRNRSHTLTGIAMIGARMFLPPTRLGMIVSYTEDTLPRAMRAQLESYGKDMWFFKPRQDGLRTCRSVQTYQAGKRYFASHEHNGCVLIQSRTEELIDYLLFDPVGLLDTPFGQPLPSTIHMVSVIDEAKNIFTQVRDISTSRQVGWSPSLIWEPYYVGPWGADRS